MRPAPRWKKIAVLGGIPLFILLLFLFFAPALGLAKHRYAFLPYYGPKEVNAPGDTTYFTVPPFAFTDQFGRPFGDRDVEGRILVVDFFFTRCTTICPRMTRQMQQLQLKLDDDAFDDVVFLSHTVDPENDTAEVLNAYARRHQADTARWKFLTGEAPTIYRQGNLGYLLSAMRDSTSAEQFVHSPNFVLVDKRKHIRGIYDGTRTSSVDSLASDIKMLIAEEKRRKREAAAAAAK